jgi:hypothetical protein
MRFSLKNVAFLLAGCALFVALGCSAAEFRQGFVTVADGVRVHYVDGGSGRGRILLFIPGWTMDASVWREQMQHFAPGHRVIAIDPRSQGESTKTPDGDTAEQRARDLATLMGRLKLDHVVLVGWSQGPTSRSREPRSSTASCWWMPRFRRDRTSRSCTRSSRRRCSATWRSTPRIRAVTCKA